MKKNKTLILIVGILLVIVVGVSFAYFLVTTNITGEGSNVNLGTGSMPKVEYDAGDSILSKDNLIPRDIISKNFKVIVTPTKDIKEVTYKIFINITENTFVKCTEDNYDEAANVCELNAEELIYRLKDSNGNIIKTGDLTGRTDNVEIARETKTQDTKTEYEYTIEIEFKDTNKDQNHNANKTFNGSINIEFAEQGKTIDDIITTLDAKTEMPDFSQVATTDEGVYATNDEMYKGTTYYWRGAATTNYLKFADFCWRIVRINGDKTIRLIYDGTTCHQNGESTTNNVIMGENDSEKYYATNDGKANNTSYVGWTYVEGKQRPEVGDAPIESNAKVKTEEWFNNSIIGKNLKKVTEGKFCNDRNVGEPYSKWSGTTSTTWSAKGTLFAYAAIDRLWNKYQPSTNCILEDIYTLKVGAITADEIELAGGKYQANEQYYLYNNQNYWSITPGYWDNAWVSMFSIYQNGTLYCANTYDNRFGLRPVINLKSDVLLKGNGTIDNPYIVID